MKPLEDDESFSPDEDTPNLKPPLADEEGAPNWNPVDGCDDAVVVVEEEETAAKKGDGAADEEDGRLKTSPPFGPTVAELGRPAGAGGGAVPVVKCSASGDVSNQ